MTDNILEIHDLVIEYHTDDAVIHAVNGIDLTVKRGESIGLVGETGAGKTTIARSIIRILQTPPAKFVSSAADFSCLCRHYAESLYDIYDYEGNIRWLLGTSYEMVSPTEWIYHLREGVKFTNGNDFNADDFLFTLDLACNTAGYYSYFPYTDYMEYCNHCGACIIDCPGGAIQKDGKDRKVCHDYFQPLLSSYDLIPRYGCGKCQTAMPCDGCIPPKREKKEV